MWGFAFQYTALLFLPLTFMAKVQVLSLFIFMINVHFQLSLVHILRLYVI